MNTELLSVLDKLKVTAIVKEIPSIPARESAVRPWRTTLVRTIGRGKDAQELRLTTVMIAATAPLAHDIVECLVHDTAAGEQPLWDFAQTFRNGQVDEQTKALLKTCTRLGKRVKRFFGNQWTDVTRAEQGLAPVVKATKGNKQEKPIRKSA